MIQLRKRVFLLIFVFVMCMMPILTVRVGAEENQNLVEPLSVSSSEETKTLVEQQIRAFAKSINQTNADNTAAKALAKHGMTGSGKKLSVGKTHALTATLWNSEVLQMAAIDTCVAAVEYMQMLDKDSLPYVNGFCGWNDSNHSYGTFACFMGDSYDYTNREYTLCHVPNYTGKRNAYDNSLDWMAGTTGMEMSFQTKKVTADEITYTVTCSIWDRFDFSTSSNSGFKNLISGLGALLFREFDWESTVTFEITVPNSCDHSTETYHWSYDPKNYVMISDSSNGYTENKTIQHIFTASNGQKQYYHELEKNIRLRHDKPWVMEYTIRNPGNFVIAPLNKYTMQQLCLTNYSNSGLLFQQKNIVDNQTTYNCYGTYYDGLLSPRITYTFRLENEIDAKGNNMIYLTIINADNQTIVLNKVPMDDYYENVNGVLNLKDSSSNYLNGVDLYINYIGNKDYSFRADYFDLRIWENGIDGEDGDYFTSKVTKPTCTARGYTTHTCSCCGYSYKDSYVSKTTHTLSDWSQVVAPSCIVVGSEQRTCRNCDYIETKEIAATGHSHMSKVTEPNCTEQGYTTHTCQCGDSFVDSYVEAEGHSFGEWIEVKTPSCLKKGMEQQICSACGHTKTREIEATGHSHTSEITEPNCAEQGYTTHTCQCGDSFVDSYVEANGHSFGEWIEIKASSCIKNGTEQQVCSACGHSETREIEATGHSHTSEVTEPNCAEQGYTTHTCQCGDSFVDSYVDAYGHTVGEWLVIREPAPGEDGHKQQSCTVCQEILASELMEALPMPEPENGFEKAVIPIAVGAAGVLLIAGVVFVGYKIKKEKTSVS